MKIKLTILTANDKPVPELNAEQREAIEAIAQYVWQGILDLACENSRHGDRATVLTAELLGD